jgi:DNA-binding response OmpR family regulator
VRVLTVDDDRETLDVLGRALRRDGHHVVEATDGLEAASAAASGFFDVIVLDVMLGAESGLDVCRRLRASGVATPILFLSARAAVGARVEGLEAGGDDYLPKPFAMRELLARVRALGRRGPALRPATVRAGDVRLDFTRRRAHLGDDEIPITAREWEVLDVLASASGRPVSFDEILDRAWGDASATARASLEVIVSRLRRKLGADAAARVLTTARGFGYALRVDR